MSKTKYYVLREVGGNRYAAYDFGRKKFSLEVIGFAQTYESEVAAAEVREMYEGQLSVKLNIDAIEI